MHCRSVCCQGHCQSRAGYHWSWNPPHQTAGLWSRHKQDSDPPGSRSCRSQGACLAQIGRLRVADRRPGAMSTTCLVTWALYTIIARLLSAGLWPWLEGWMLVVGYAGAKRDLLSTHLWGITLKSSPLEALIWASYWSSYSFMCDLRFTPDDKCVWISCSPDPLSIACVFLVFLSFSEGFHMLQGSRASFLDSFSLKKLGFLCQRGMLCEGKVPKITFASFTSPFSTCSASLIKTARQVSVRYKTIQ